MREKSELTESGSISFSYVEEFEWPLLIYRAWDRLKEMEAYRVAITAMERDETVADHLGKLVGTAEHRRTIDAGGCLQSLLIELLQEQGGTDFRDDVFEKVYQDIEDYFYERVFEFRIIGPLQNIELERDRIELGPSLSIVRMPRSDRERMYRESREFGPLSRCEIWPPEYAFELEARVTKQIGAGGGAPPDQPPSRIARHEFDEACSALRLFKKGAVGYCEIRIEKTGWSPMGGILRVLPSPPRSIAGEAYTMSNEEIERFLEFWGLYRRARLAKRNRIDIALRRFNFAYERPIEEDKLIDYLIGFEALLLKQEEQQELAYRLALRGAALLANDADERRDRFVELKSAYEERSKIVHGGSARGSVRVGRSKVPFKEFVNGLEERLRLAIRKFLLLCERQSEGQLIEALDDKIVGG